MRRRRIILAAAVVALLVAGCTTHGLEGERVKLPDGRHVVRVADRKHGFGAFVPSCDWSHAK